jgi:hypothetical protein
MSRMTDFEPISIGLATACHCGAQRGTRKHREDCSNRPPTAARNFRAEIVWRSPSVGGASRFGLAVLRKAN